MAKKKPVDKDRVESATITLYNDAYDTLSNNAAGSALGSLEELVFNGWDADAPRIEIPWKDDEIRIRDYGIGMTPDIVKHKFLSVGNSDKGEEKFSPGGRPYMGSFGMAVHSVGLIGRELQVRTVRDGVKTAFGLLTEKRELGMEVPLRITEGVTEGNGTEIIISKLYEKQSDNFSPEALWRSLSKSDLFATGEDNFAVFINGKQVKSRRIDGAHEFQIAYEVPDIGTVTGIGYLLKQPTDGWGTYVHVNKRRIGNPQLIMELPDSLKYRMVLRVHADGLQPFINQHRDAFLNHEPVRLFFEYLSTTSREMRSFSESQRSQNKAAKLQAAGEKVAANLASKLRDMEIPEMMQRNSIEMVYNLPKKTAGKITSKVIQLNAGHPLLDSRVVVNPKHFETAVKHLTCRVIAQHRAGDSLTDYLSAEAELLELLTPAAAKTSVQIFPNLVYPLADLDKITRFERVDFNYMVDNCVLKLVGSNRTSGTNFLFAQDAFEGYYPLPQFVRAYLADIGSHTIKSLHTGFNKIGDVIDPFVVNVGSAKNPCYGIAPFGVSVVSRFAQETDFRYTKKKLIAELQGVTEIFMVPSKLAEHLKKDESAVQRVLAYGNQAATEPSFRKEGKKGSMRYHVGDVVKTHTYMIQNNVLPFE